MESMRADGWLEEQDLWQAFGLFALRSKLVGVFQKQKQWPHGVFTLMLNSSLAQPERVTVLLGQGSAPECLQLSLPGEPPLRIVPLSL